jgi:hypothetical protein
MAGISVFFLGSTVVGFICFILILRVYYRQCDDKSGLAFIQFTHYYDTTPFFAIRYNPHG